MKKFFLTLFFMSGIFLLLSQGEVLWSKRRFLDEPRVHKVQKGESLSKLAKQYYGDTKRWRELALVNRAPKPNHLEVGEEVLLPTEPVINELRRSRTITKVNTLIGEQEKTATSQESEFSNQPTQPKRPAEVVSPTAKVETPAANSEDTKLVPETTPENITAPADTATDDSGFPWFWLAIGVIIVAGAAGFIWYRRQQAEKAESEIKTLEPRRSFDDRGRDRQAFTTPSPQKENLAV
jgi:LysM repeat protein